MYQFNAELFDFITPGLLYSEVFQGDDDEFGEDQSDCLSKIEERVLTEKLYDENNITLLAIAYMHPSVLNMKHLSSLTDEELKSKVFDKMNEIIFNKTLTSYNKSVLLERLSIIVKGLSDNDKKEFKRNVLDLSSSDIEDFQELYYDMVDRN